VRRYRSYVDELAKLVARAARHPFGSELQSQVAAALDGQSSSELRRLIDRKVLRACGLYFTSSELSTLVADRLCESLSPTSVVIDPACGAGDLLLACATRMVCQDLGTAGRIDDLTERVRGLDIREQFVRAARYRLRLLAVRQVREIDARPSKLGSIPRFDQVKVGDGLNSTRALRAATHVVINPPFVRIPAPRWCTWTSGKVNSASVFLARIVEQVRPGTRIVAILPDVLRSGTRYVSWRLWMEDRVILRSMELYGQFDSYADVDVFVAEYEVGCRAANLAGREKQLPTVADHFDVRVGPVVEHRSARKGSWQLYATPTELPPWKTIRDIAKRRRFSGTLVRPPFVAVRRTSSPGDRERPVASIVASPSPIAVENHLITIQPKDGRLKPCQELMELLRAPKSREWLDRRIRCRHLTVSSLSDLPWSIDESR